MTPVFWFLLSAQHASNMLTAVHRLLHLDVLQQQNGAASNRHREEPETPEDTKLQPEELREGGGVHTWKLLLAFCTFLTRLEPARPGPGRHCSSGHSNCFQGYWVSARPSPDQILFLYSRPGGVAVSPLGNSFLPLGASHLKKEWSEGKSRRFLYRGGLK